MLTVITEFYQRLLRVCNFVLVKKTSDDNIFLILFFSFAINLFRTFKKKNNHRKSNFICPIQLCRLREQKISALVVAMMLQHNYSCILIKTFRIFSLIKAYFIYFRRNRPNVRQFRTSEINVVGH